MTQKTALVTGGSAGIGYAVAKQLLEQGFAVILTSRSRERAEDAATRLNGQLSDTPAAKGLALDLTDLHSVTGLIESVAAGKQSIDYLVTNAGVKIERPYRKTAQGFEWHYGINHLGHYLLARELANAGNHFHLTTVASIVARIGDPKKWQIHDIDVGASSQYAASKLANLVLAQAVALKIPAWSANLTASAAHPGFTKAEPYGTAVTRVGETLLAQNCEAGALPIVAAVTSADGASDFQYLGPKLFELWGGPARAKVPKAATAYLAQKLVAISEEQLARAGF